MKRISSNTTLFWKIFLPTFWFSFYGILTIVVWAYGDIKLGILSDLKFRLGVTLFYAIGSILIYFTILNIKRVEYEDEFLYITNYFRTIKVPFILIEHIDIQNYTIFKRGKIYLHKATPLGKNIVFIVSTQLIEEMVEEYPRLFLEPEYNE